MKQRSILPGLHQASFVPFFVLYPISGQCWETLWDNWLYLIKSIHSKHCAVPYAVWTALVPLWQASITFIWEIWSFQVLNLLHMVNHIFLQCLHTYKANLSDICHCHCRNWWYSLIHSRQQLSPTFTTSLQSNCWVSDLRHHIWNLLPSNSSRFSRFLAAGPYTCCLFATFLLLLLIN